jgi:hypothetical protein
VLSVRPQVFNEKVQADANHFCLARSYTFTTMEIHDFGHLLLFGLLAIWLA